MKPTLVMAGLLAAAVAAVRPAAAQEDFRSADPDRPIRVEDAYPLKYLEWEWEIGTETRLAEGGTYAVAGLLEVKTGIARNWQVGIELHPAWERAAGLSTGGLEEFGAHVLFNLNQEGAVAPALAVRGDVVAPGAGDVGRSDVGGRLKGMLTRGFGRGRLHANGGYTWATTADGGDFWIAGLAFDYPIGLFSKSVLGDVYAEFPAGGTEVRVWAELGTRWQISNASVVDFGVTTRLDRWGDGVANIGFVIGIARVFGIPGLVRVPPYPNPRIN